MNNYEEQVNTSHMEEFDVIENYLRHGDYPIGIAKIKLAMDVCIIINFYTRTLFIL